MAASSFWTNPAKDTNLPRVVFARIVSWNLRGPGVVHSFLPNVYGLWSQMAFCQ